MMTHTQPDPALPPGADPNVSSDWETDLDSLTTCRSVWTVPTQLGERLDELDVRGVATQLADGTIVTDGDFGPCVYVGCFDYTIDEARTLATAIGVAADTVEHWLGRVDGRTRLADAKSAVLSAYTALCREPNNAGDYLRAALDSLADAEAVLR